MGLGLLAVAFAACGSDRAPARVTEAEAREMLDRAVAHATSGDLDALCDLGGSAAICERHLRDHGGDNVPHRPPEVIDVRTLDTSSGEAIVLVVCADVPWWGEVRTEFLVQPAPDGPIAPYPVYWSGIQIAGVGAANSQPTPPVAGDPGDPRPVTSRGCPR